MSFFQFIFFQSELRCFSQDCSPNDEIASRARFYSTSLLIYFQSCHLGFSAYILRCSVAPANTSFPTRYSQSATLLVIFITLSFIFFLLVLPSDQRQLLLDLSNLSFVGCFYLLNYPRIAPLCVT